MRTRHGHGLNRNSALEIFSSLGYGFNGFGRAENRFRAALRDGRGKSEHQRARCRVTVAAVHDRRYGYTRADPDVLPGFDGQCHRKLNRRRRKLAARVKRCGKSAPREAQATRHGKPHRVQGQIGNPGATRSRFRESETDSGYRLHRQMVLSTRKGADRIRLTALPRPIQIPKSRGTSYTSPTTGRARHSVRAGARFCESGAQGTDAPYPSQNQFKIVIPFPLRTGWVFLIAAGELTLPTRSTALTAMTSGLEFSNVRVV